MKEYRRQDQKDFKKFCPSHNLKAGSPIPNSFPTDILFPPLTQLLKMFHDFSCFLTSVLCYPYCYKVSYKVWPKSLSLPWNLLKKKWAWLFLLITSPGKRCHVKKTDVRKSFGSLHPEYQVKEKSRSEMSCSGSARLQKGQQHHHLLEGVNLANVPVATKGGVRNAFGRYAA